MLQSAPLFVIITDTLLPQPLDAPTSHFSCARFSRALSNPQGAFNSFTDSYDAVGDVKAKTFIQNNSSISNMVMSKIENIADTNSP